MVDSTRLIFITSPWDNSYGANISIYWYYTNDGINSNDIRNLPTIRSDIEKYAKKIATTVYHQSSNSITVSKFDNNFITLQECARLTADLMIEESTRASLCKAMGIENFEFLPIWCKQTGKHYSK